MEQLPAKRPSYFDSVLSIEGDGCNIAASAANTKAYELAQSKQEEDFFAVIGDITEVRRLTYVNLKSIKLHDGENTYDTPRSLDLLLEYGDLKSDIPTPRLLGVVHDIALPIASFQQRPHGQCGWVQLGPEMAEDKLVVTSRDVRTNYVEAIRKVLSKDDLTEDDKILITSLYKDEAAKYSGDITTQYDYALSRKAWRVYANNTPAVERVSIATSDHDVSVREDMSTVVLLDPSLVFKLSDKITDTINPSIQRHNYNSNRDQMAAYLKLETAGRQYGFKLARRFQVDTTKHRFGREKSTLNPESTLYLIATDENGIAIPIASLPHGGTPTIYRQDTAQTQHTTVEVRSEIDNILTNFDKHSFWFREAITGLGGTIGAAIRDIGQGYSSGLSRKVENVQRTIDNFVKDQARTADVFDIHERFDRAIGPFNKHLEAVAIRIGRLSLSNNGLHTGKLKDRKIDRTIDDADTFIHAEVIDEMTRFVQISGRPSSQPDKQPVIVFNETIYLDRPNSIDAEKVTEILEILLTVTKNPS